MIDAIPPGQMARAVAITLLLWLTGGCAGDGRVEATTVLALNQCHGVTPGVTRVDYARVAAIRGGTLLEMTAPTGQAIGTPGTQPDGETDGPVRPGAATRAGANDPLLVAVSRGPQPTPGYAMSLNGAHRRDRTAVVSVRWHEPEPGTVLAQVITRPCLVVALPKADFQQVEAVDQTGDLIGRLTL